MLPNRLVSKLRTGTS